MSNATPDDDSAPAEPAGATVVPDWDALFTEVYTRLKAMASRQIGRQSAATLQTTALVHEAYLRMRKAGGLQFAEREQFFAYAARAMRHLLLDRARDRLRATGGRSPSPSMRTMRACRWTGRKRRSPWMAP